MTNQDKMAELHEAVTDTLIEAMDDSNQRIKATELAIKFLHNNGVNCDMNKSSKVHSLTAHMPTFDAEAAQA